HLTQDLALPQHGRVQTAGHREEVGGGGVAVVAVEVVGELLRGGVAELGQEVAGVDDGAVEPFGHGVDLRALTRGEHDDLREVLAPPQVGQGLGQTCFPDGHPLEEDERNRTVAEPYDDDRHVCSRSLARSTSPALMRSRMSESRASCQARPSVERPCARIASRCSDRISASTSYSGPSSSENRALSQRARAGLRPPVDTARVMGPRRTMDGSMKLQDAGSSAAFTHTPASSASSATWRLTSPSSVATTTRRYPDASPGRQ